MSETINLDLEHMSDTINLDLEHMSETINLDLEHMSSLNFLHYFTIFLAQLLDFPLKLIRRKEAQKMRNFVNKNKICDNFAKTRKFLRNKIPIRWKP